MKSKSGKIFFKLIKFWFWSFASMAVLILILFIYYNSVTRITPPNVEDKSSLKWEREKVDSVLFMVKNNWLHKSSTGLWELYIEGSPFERGAASGNLCKELLYEQEVAFTDKLKEMVPDEYYLNFLKYFIAWFNRNLEDYIPLEYQLEIYGESFFGPKEFEYIGENYPRMLNYHAAHDIGHALANANMVGCTSFSARDSATKDGKMIIGRNFDFTMGDDFAKHKIVLFVSPDSGYNFSMVTWPGFLGAVSGMNEKGLTITLNAAPSEIPRSAKTPVSVLAREILQYASNIAEAIEIASRREVFVSELLMIGSALDHKTIIIEKSPKQQFIFEQTEDVLTCSNHYQTIELQSENKEQFEKTSTLYRENRMKELIAKYNLLTPTEAALILRDRYGLNGVNLGMGNENAMNQLAAHHGVIFKPEERKMWVSCNPYQLGAFICYNLDSVFSRAKNFRNERRALYDSSSSIMPDPFLLTREYRDWEVFKELIHEISMIINGKQGRIFSEKMLNDMILLNPEYYLGYALAGEYQLMRAEFTSGIGFLKQALGKNIPLNTERIKLENRVKWAEQKLKK
jgi:isopenicillin-N N-acyltransferase-like protein